MCEETKRLKVEMEARGSSAAVGAEMAWKLGQVDDPLNRQMGGTHYFMRDIQPFDFLRANRVPHAEGEAIYHILRHKQKGGRLDLEKAVHYLQMIMGHDYPVSVAISEDYKTEAKERIEDL